MDNVNAALIDIRNINRAYELSTDNIDKMIDEISHAKVCTPIIGKFSSGKSALVNTLLGYSYKILQEDITPETAIPAEIVYSDSIEQVTIIGNNGAVCKTMDINEYRNYEADANTVKSARIQLNCRNLQSIPDIMLVDMPGFESGFEIHNKAIDNYLPQSLAYVVTIPADDMIIRSTIGNILKELCLHDMPLCIVITKYDKRNDDFEETLAYTKESLKRFVGERSLRFCNTSSFTGEVDDFMRFLLEIQQQSAKILAGKYRRLALGIVENTENYLITTLKGSQLSESELSEQEDKLHNQLATLDSSFSKQRHDFDMEISSCVEEIKNDVRSALESEESTLVAMAMNNQNISSQINQVVRNTVTVSIQNRLIPRVQKYVKKMAHTINENKIGDVNISFSFDTKDFQQKMTASVVAVAAGIVVGLPILGLLGAIVAGIISKISADKKRKEAKQQIKMKLQCEVFPQVLREVGNGIEKTVTEQIALVNTSIEEELKQQKDTLEKAMADLKVKMNDEKSKKENLAIDINRDLATIEEIKLSLA